MKLQRVYVLTASAPCDLHSGEASPEAFAASAKEGAAPLVPSFLVSHLASDAFILEVISREFGRRDDGRPHDWVAYDEDERIRCAPSTAHGC